MTSDLTSATILETIDPYRFEAIRAAHVGDDFAKYLDLPLWIEINLQRARALGLHETTEPKRVLDIGCGCGYFLHVCRLLEHDVTGLDLASIGLYHAMTQLLEIPVVYHRIMPFVPLPFGDYGVGRVFLGRYDVITAYMVTFNGHNVAPWGVAEWRFLLDDLKSHLEPEGTVYLELNREAATQSCYTPELKQFLEDRGAVISGGSGQCVLFRP